MFYLGFGQAIASFSPNDLLASLLVPLFFTFIVSFCGVVVPYAALPYFWRSWMYRLSPFTYLLEGMLGLITDGVPIRCSTSELAIFPPPPGQSCQSYAGSYAQQAGGYVQTQANGDCGFCQYSSGTQFARSFNINPAHIWRDFGLFWVYIVFNFAVVFLCSYLYLGGLQKIKDVVSPTARRNRREMRKRQSDKA